MGRGRAKPSLRFTSQMMGAGFRRSLTPLRVWWRANWFYRRLLKGQLADHIAFYPYDALPRRLEDADALLRAQFRLAGETVEIEQGSVFDVAPPSAEWREALNSFAWLPCLSAAGGDAARRLATNLIAQWIKRHPRYSEPAWEPHIIARRLMHLFSHGRMVVVNSDMLWRSRLFVSLREQAKMLARISGEAPDGLPRFEAAAGLVLSGICLDDSRTRLTQGLERLEAEIARQILPDGGHVSRSPESLVHAYRHLLMVIDALGAVEHEVPAVLRSAHDRMAPMVRFFRHADGGLALFNGGHEGDPRIIAGLLARDEVRGAPFAHAPYSGYQRLARGRTLCLIDCGMPPPDGFSLRAHSGFLAFELSSGSQRIVVNCGTAGASHRSWESALRATAAHSTLVLADNSSATIMPQGMARDLLGPRLIAGPSEVTTDRRETAHGWTVDAAHDGYVPGFGIRHERRITLSFTGTTLTGADRLVPQPGARESLGFAVRFHIHPDIQISKLEGGGILLKLAGGEGWRFRAGGGMLGVEESVYLSGEMIRRTEQLVISGQVSDQPVEVAWLFEQIGA